MLTTTKAPAVTCLIKVNKVKSAPFHSPAPTTKTPSGKVNGVSAVPPPVTCQLDPNARPACVPCDALVKESKLVVFPTNIHCAGGFVLLPGK